MNKVQTNLQSIYQKIQTITKQVGLPSQGVTLVAVSKTQPIALIQDAINAGQFTFGENYVQEGVEKITHFKNVLPDVPLSWHFIGSLQSNKSRLVAEHFDWIHTIDRFKIAQRLSDQRPSGMQKINALIQVNISQEKSKSGIEPAELLTLAEQIALLPNIKLRGLMVIPEIEMDFDKQRAIFTHTAQLFAQLKQNITSVDTLSMGMSNDMDAAILAGSTMVRVGTAIFGSRINV